MSNEYEDLDDDDTTDTGAQAPRAIREQNKKLARELKEAQEQLAQLQGQVRRTSIADALKQHGASDRLAKYVDIEDSSPDGVLKWLQENGEDFGWQPPEQEDEEETDRRAMQRRITSAGASAPEGRIPDLQTRLNEAKSPQELQEIYRQYARQ